jgi:DNA invertase Pin-like site-specific DNA recombinase
MKDPTDAIYGRVSDDKKKSDGERRQDVNRQTDILKDFAKRKGITEIKEYIDDGKSAFTDDLNQRPAFKQLLNDCRAHWIKNIYIEDMTRFSRNLLLGLQLLKELGELNVNIISVKEGEIEVTSSKGWMQSTWLLMFAEWDSRVKSEKVKSGMEKALSKICPYCKIAHLGRHPKRCQCPNCLRVGQNFPKIPKDNKLNLSARES